MRKKIHLDPQKCRSLYEYDRDTGVLTNRTNRRNAKKGAVSGTISEGNAGKLYRVVRYGNRQVKAHRVIWVIMTGDQPDVIDHIDGDGLNNKWSNLRSISHRLNSKYRKTSKANTTGRTGVYRTPHNTWRAYIFVEGTNHFLGIFKKKEDAIMARETAEREYGMVVIK